MIYKMELSDSVDTMVFDLLEVPIVDKDITGIAENTTIDGNVFNDYLWLKKQYVQKWSIMCQDEYDRLRGFWTRQFGNAEVPFYRLFYGENVYEDKNFLTSDGFTQITNPTERTAPLSLTHLYGNAEQKTLSGKNICSNATVAGNTSIRFYFDKTNSTNIVLSAITNATTDRASVYLVVDSTEIARIGAFSGGANQRGSAILTLTQTQIDAIQAGASSWLNLYVGGGDFASVSEAQIESGSSMTAYEPYVGGIPSPNPDYPQEIKTVTGAQTVKITGKNLFDKNAITSGYLVSRGIGTLSQNSSYGATDFIPVSAGQQLHFGDDFNRWYSAYYDANKVAVGEPTNTANITIPDGVAYLRTSLLLTNLDTAQLELGNQATPFEPYQSQSLEINLGKNLFDTDTAVTRFEAYNGNAINDWGTYSDGVVTIVKSNGAHGTCAFAGFKPKFVEGQTYTLSANVYLEGTNASKQLRFGTVTNSNTAITIASKDEWLTVVKTFTATASDVSDPRIDIQAYNTGNTVQIKEIQLELGTQATTYSPFKHFSKNYCYQTVLQDANDIQFYIIPPKSATVTLSAIINVATTSNSVYLTVDGEGLGRVGTISGSANARQKISITFTDEQFEAIKNGNVSFLQLYKPNAGFTQPQNAQVEDGSVATNFESFSAPLELAKIGTYQDYIWNDDGTWKIHKAINKIVLDGTVNNQFDGTFATTPNGFAVYKSFWDGDHYMGGVSDKFTASNKSYPDMPLYSFIGMSGAVTTYTFILPSTITSKTDANNWLSAHNTTVYYPLATPTDTEITDSELIEQLNHIYSLYQGQNNLWLIGTGAQGEIDGTYRLIYDEETDIIPKTPVVLTLTDGGVINPCGCRQNIQLIMRETEGE